MKEERCPSNQVFPGREEEAVRSEQQVYLHTHRGRVSIAGWACER